MSVENAKFVGSSTEVSRIAVLYITPTEISYVCNDCQCHALNSIDAIDAEKMWYTFPCGTCENTRMVNLRKVLGGGGTL